MAYVKAPAGMKNPCEPYPWGPMRLFGSWSSWTPRSRRPPPTWGRKPAPSPEELAEGQSAADVERQSVAGDGGSQGPIRSQAVSGDYPAPADRGQAAVGCQTAKRGQAALVVERQEERRSAATASDLAGRDARVGPVVRGETIAREAP